MNRINSDSKKSIEDLNNHRLSSSEEVLFDARPNSTADNPPTKSISTLESIKAFIQQAIHAIRTAFQFKSHQEITITNIKSPIILKPEIHKNKINNETVVSEVNAVSSRLNNAEINVNDPLLDDFEIIKTDIENSSGVDDFEMDINYENKDEIVKEEAVGLLDERTDEIKTENYGAFANWYRSGADTKAIPDDAIGYAKYLIRTHVDKEKIKDISELLAMVKAAENLVEEVERKEPSFFELGLALKVDAQKESKSNASFGVVVNKRHDKDLLKKYLNEESQKFIQIFHPNNGIQNQSEKNQIKNDAKTFLFWKTLWSPIMTKSDLTVQNYESRLVKTPTEAEKNIIAKKFKEGEFKIFNDQYIASDKDLDACKRFIEKYEAVIQTGSENQKEELDILDLNKYIQDFKEFYLDLQSLKIKQKEEESLTIEKHVQDLSLILPEIIIFQSLNTEAIQALHTILAPELPMPSFQKIISEAKSYFSNIGNDLIIKDEDRAAALVIASWWPKLNANAKPITNKSETSDFFGQINSLFASDPLPRLEALPNFEKLNALLNEEKISNDFK